MRGTSSYVVYRVLLAVPTLIGLTLGVFALSHLAPGDPAVEFARQLSPTGEPTTAQVERMRGELGLDRPLPVQYADFVSGAVRGNLGESFRQRRPVGAEIGRRLGATAELALASLALAVVLSLPLAVLAALHHRRWLDNGLRVVALTAASIPSFFFAYILVAIFAANLGLLPVAGRSGLSSLVLPALALSLGPTAIISRLLRSSLLEVLTEDYIRTARSKGLSERRTIVGHALRNAAAPVVTELGTVFGHLLTGAVIIEFIFAWPGLGRLALEAVVTRDYPLIQGVVLFAGVVFVVLNVLIDLTYPLLDPRVRLGGRMR